MIVDYFLVRVAFLTTNYMNVFTLDSVAIVLWQFRLFVRLSVCLSHGWISQKRLKLGSPISPYSSPITLVFRGYVSSRNSKGFPPSGGLKQGRGG